MSTQKKLKNNIVSFLLIFLSLSISAFSSEKDNKTQKKPFITEGLFFPDRVNEIHFLWTSGVEWNHISDPDPKEYIGGSKEMMEKFQAYLTYLLETSPKSIIFRIVTDRKTCLLNPWLEALHARYPTQFFVEDIKEISKRLQKKYPEFEETIETLFLNGTQGNPTVAADAYKLVGALGGYERSPQTYHIACCDIDTFAVFGTDGENTETLLKSLLAVELVNNQKGFLMQEKDGHCFQDIVVSCFGPDLAPYEEACKEILKKWSDSCTLAFLRQFRVRYEMMRAINNKEDFERYKILPPIDIEKLIYITGPAFGHQFPFSHGVLSYPTICSVSWDPLFGNRENIINFSLEGINQEPIAIELKEFRSIFKKTYIHLLDDALYSQRRLGPTHPSGAIMKELLVLHNPFKSEAFKRMVHKSYYSLHADYSGDLVQEECAKFLAVVQQIPAYAFLKEKLEVLNLPFSLTVQDLVSYVGKIKDSH